MAFSQAQNARDAWDDWSNADFDSNLAQKEVMRQVANYFARTAALNAAASARILVEFVLGLGSAAAADAGHAAALNVYRQFYC